MPIDTIEVQVGGALLSDLDQVSDEIAGVAKRALDDATPQLQAATRVFLEEVYAKLQRAHGTPWQPGGSGSNLFSRTGQGLRDIQASISVSGRGADVSGTIGISGYMAVQESGATIRPRRSKYLTVPLPAAMDSRGVSLRKRARDWPDTFVARSKRGSLLIYQKRGRQIVPLYVLRESVTLKPRLRFVETLEGALPYFEAKVFEALDRALGGH